MSQKVLIALLASLLLLLIIAAVVLVLISQGIIKPPAKSLVTLPGKPREPSVSLQTQYQNPFDGKFVNPFAGYKNPFDALR